MNSLKSKILLHNLTKNNFENTFEHFERDEVNLKN